MAITVHIHDRHGHRIIDQGAQGSTGTPGTAYGGRPRRTPRPDKPPGLKAGGFTVDQPPVQPPVQPAAPRSGGMTHEQAAQRHEAAAQQHVGMNYGAQNPVSRAHTEAAKAHKTAHSLFGKPGYPQARHWATSASEHAHRLSAPQAKDYGTAEGARHRQEGGGYSSASTRPQPTPGYGSAPHQQQTRQAGRLAHLQQQASHPLFGGQHQPEIRRLQQQQRGHDASSRAPGTPKPPSPPKPKAPPSPKPPASAAPPKPPQPKPPGATPPKASAAPKAPKLPAAPRPRPPQASPGPATHVARATEAVAKAAEVPHGIIQGLGAIQQWGENLRTRDRGTSIGGRRGHATRRHLKAEDETKIRRNWFPDLRSIDAWFYRDFDESKHTRGGDPKHSGRFSKGSGSKASSTESGAAKEGETKPESKPKPEGKPKASKETSPAAYLFQQQGDIPDPKGNPKDPAYQAAAKGYMDKFYEKRSAEDRRAIEDAKAENDAMDETYKTFTDEKGKYTDERQREHDRILFSGPKALFSQEAVDKAKPPEGKQPTFYMIGGRGGSGKSWFTQKDGRLGKAKRDGAILIDSDDIKAALPGYQPHLAGRYHEEASFLVDRAVNYARANGLNLILDATMKTFSKKTSDRTETGELCDPPPPPDPNCEPVDGGALEKLKLFKGNSSTPMGSGLAMGRHSYRVEGHYMFAPMDVAMNNAVDRFAKVDPDTKIARYSGRFVPPEYILSSTTNEETFDKLREFLDDWSLYDNSEMAQRKTEGYRVPPKLVAERPKQAEA